MINDLLLFLWDFNLGLTESVFANPLKYLISEHSFALNIVFKAKMQCWGLVENTAVWQSASSFRVSDDVLLMHRSIGAGVSLRSSPLIKNAIGIIAVLLITMCYYGRKGIGIWKMVCFVVTRMEKD